MNILLSKSEADILKALQKSQMVTQRQLSRELSYSVGTVNQSLQKLIEKKLIDPQYHLTALAKKYLKKHQPKRAVILAAGFGIRMLPMDTQIPKGLIEVFKECLIERLILQLQTVGIEEIYIVVGFMKEKFEYLIDRYHVKLIVNTKYHERNNLYSLYLAKEHLENAYVLPCDVWCRYNPFSTVELYSWYMVQEQLSYTSTITVTRTGELALKKAHQTGNGMVGVSYFDAVLASRLKVQLEQTANLPQFFEMFWEDALFQFLDMPIFAKMMGKDDVHEVNTYDDLIKLDAQSKQLQSKAVMKLCDIFKVSQDKIQQIQMLKKGMTNRSFMFVVNHQKYIMRIPGEGTKNLIKRQNEYAVYQVIRDFHLSDEVIYFGKDNGYKVTRYLENTRSCNPFDDHDLELCMQSLRKLHQMPLEVDHTFDLFEQIDFYEKLRNKDSVYQDYQITKKHIFELKKLIEQSQKQIGLTHIDAVYDNFLIQDQRVYLIDWEYAAMQDVHLDLAMFAIYALYNKEQVDHLLDIYFQGNTSEEIKRKIYAYVAICGLLWSNWCEYKQSLGVEFGEYSIRQYRYAKEFYQLVSTKE